MADGYPDEPSPAEAILVPPRADAYPSATAEWDASADVLLGAMEDASPEPQHCPDAGAGKLAALALDVQEPGAWSLPERSAKRA